MAARILRQHRLRRTCSGPAMACRLPPIVRPARIVGFDAGANVCVGARIVHTVTTRMRGWALAARLHAGSTARHPSFQSSNGSHSARTSGPVSRLTAYTWLLAPRIRQVASPRASSPRAQRASFIPIPASAVALPPASVAASVPLDGAKQRAGKPAQARKSRRVRPEPDVRDADDPPVDLG